MADTDVLVVGGGPGGYAAAFLAADRGLSVTLVDPEANPGGVCVYRGCIPSKVLLHVAQVMGEARRAAEWGVSFGEPAIDLAKLRRFKDSVVARLTAGTGQLVSHRKVQYLRGRAEILDAHRARVLAPQSAEQVVSFGHAILATGSAPAMPPALRLDDPRVMDSTAALDLPDIPASLLVVGGGYIGLELGSVYAALGSRVTVVEMTDGLLPGADRDLVSVLSRQMARSFQAVRLKTRVAQLSTEASGIRVQFEGENVDEASREQRFDRVLVAVGRRPNGDVPGLERTAVRRNERGFIVVDQQMRTDERSIFAIGDVVGEPMLAHKASHEGRVAVEVIAGDKVALDARAIPAVVFTDPELAWCGLTEALAQRDHIEVAVARFPWGASGRANTLGRPEGLTKLVLDPRSGRILGVGIVGAGAGELIAEGVVAIEMGATAADLKLSIHPHPTLSETLMEAAEVFFGQATHVFRPTTARRGEQP
jgi:dihydrolipoamide dehydrogenase